MTGAGKWTPTIDVIVSTYNEEAYIDRCLDFVLGQDYPSDRITVWLVDGGSTDGTVAAARRWAVRDPRLVIIADGVRRNLPAALNVAIERGEGELVAKIDAHGYPERDFLTRAVEAFRSEGHDVACTGGRPEQEGETAFGTAVALARTSRFGVGGSVYAGSSRREMVDTVQCGVYRRAPLVAVGSFDPAMNYGEDEEVNWRLRKAGCRILLDSAIRFHYVTRPSWRAAYRQYRNYGRARVNVVQRHPGYLRPRHLMPSVFLAALAALAVASPVSRSARRALAATGVAYGAVGLIEGRRQAGAGRPGLAARVAACFAALHLGYGIGMIRGLAARARAR